MDSDGSGSTDREIRHSGYAAGYSDIDILTSESIFFGVDAYETAHHSIVNRTIGNQLSTKSATR